MRFDSYFKFIAKIQPLKGLPFPNYKHHILVNLYYRINIDLWFHEWLNMNGLK